MKTIVLEREDGTHMLLELWDETVSLATRPTQPDSWSPREICRVLHVEES